MGSQQTFQPTWALIKKPDGYPLQPAPGKLEIIWDNNYHSLYHRLSPYADYNHSLIGGFTTQPYNYTYPDEGKKGLAGLRKYESRMFPLGSAPLDVIRVAKFLGSGNGILFLGKQFLLQTGNSFNETRIYNPTSTVVAAGMGLSMGSIRPSRNLDISGLGGLARSLIGNAIPDALFGAPKIQKPAGTAPDALVGGPLESTGGKGLLRAGDANRGRSHLEASWVAPGNTTKSFKSVVKGMVTSLFANFIPATQKGIKHRSDEGAYGLMLAAGGSRFGYTGANGEYFDFGQMWYGGGKTIRKNNEEPSKQYKLFYLAGNSIKIDPKSIKSGFYFSSMHVGYDIASNPTADLKPGLRYGDNVGKVISGDEYASSDMMINYYLYNNPPKNVDVPTKVDDRVRVRNLNSSLQAVLDSINKTSGGIPYSITLPDDATVMHSPNATVNGYDRIAKTSDRGMSKSGLNYPLGLLKDYRNSKVVDQTLVSGQNGQTSYKLPTNGNFDGINTLTVLDKDKHIPNSRLKNWISWEPYEDDLIAFYFYDVVNEKYIPFRATIKGLSESGNASWEELSFIGRGDKIHSYGGFNRNANFSFQIVIGSLVELAPTWQRVNYLTTLIKPANYTTDNYNNVTNRFMVPPMVMLTIGDLYKDQPVLIQSITTTIPDDAIWEVQNEFNSSQWSHLAGNITGDSSLNYAQVPRTIDVSVNLVMLEKSRAVVGGANFGHDPRTDANSSIPNEKAVPNGAAPNRWHSNIGVNVVDNSIKTPPVQPTPPRKMPGRSSYVEKASPPPAPVPIIKDRPKYVRTY